MMVMLTIDHVRLLLPNERGLSAVISALSRARRVTSDRRYSAGQIDLEGHPEVQTEMLPNYRLGKRAPGAIEPDEVLPPSRAEIAAPQTSTSLAPRRARPSRLPMLPAFAGGQDARG